MEGEKDMEEKKEEKKTLRVDIFMILVCFFLPFMGYMIYAIHVLASPREAKDCMKFAIVGTILEVALAWQLTIGV